jgi:hypothetical protein
MPDPSQIKTDIRSFLKRNFPSIVHVHNFYTNRKFKNKSVDEVFTSIHSKNAWGNSESKSGEGSEVKQAQALIESLPAFLKKHHLHSLLDLPCGDFNWMQHVDYGSTIYTGADIVENIISRNQQLYASDQRAFKKLDLTSDPLDKVDVIFIRDCLVHLSYDYIHSAFENIKRAGITYILITSYIRSDTNYDIVTGGWRKLNFQKAPFNFPPPIDYIDEKCQEGPYFEDKVMALWRVADLDL